MVNLNKWLRPRGGNNFDSYSSIDVMYSNWEGKVVAIGVRGTRFIFGYGDTIAMALKDLSRKVSGQSG